MIQILPDPDTLARRLETRVAQASRELLVVAQAFDPKAPLRSPDLKERGLADWGDLMAWVSRRGVEITLLYADVDPVFQAERHRNTWRQASAMVQRLEGPAQVICALHGHRAGGLWRWRLRRMQNAGLALLDGGTPRHRTVLQRAALRTPPPLRPHRINASFALIDGETAVLGPLLPRPQETSQGPDVTPTGLDLALEIDDADWCGALRPFFATLWQAALDHGGTALTGTPLALSVQTQRQSRASLRLLRTLSAPGTHPLHLAGQSLRADLPEHLLRQIPQARQQIHMETTSLRDDAVTDALCAAGAAEPALELVMVLHKGGDRLPFDATDAGLQHEADRLENRQIARLQARFGPRFRLLHPGGDNARHLPGGLGHLVIIDARWSYAGSAAMTPAGLSYNSEAGVFIDDTDVTRDLLDTRRTALESCAATPPGPHPAPKSQSPLPPEVF